MVFVGDANVHTYVFLSSNALGIFEMIAVFEGEKLQTNNSPG